MSARRVAEKGRGDSTPRDGQHAPPQPANGWSACCGSCGGSASRKQRGELAPRDFCRAPDGAVAHFQLVRWDSFVARDGAIVCDDLYELVRGEVLIGLQYALSGAPGNLVREVQPKVSLQQGGRFGSQNEPVFGMAANHLVRAARLVLRGEECQVEVAVGAIPHRLSRLPISVWIIALIALEPWIDAVLPYAVETHTGCAVIEVLVGAPQAQRSEEH